MFILKELHNCTHVFLRTDAVGEPLQTPYTGPYKVVKRLSDQLYTIQIKENDVNVKPAFIINDTQRDTTSENCNTPDQQSTNFSPQGTSSAPQFSSTMNVAQRRQTPSEISFQSDPDLVTGEGVDVAAPSLPVLRNQLYGNASENSERTDRRKQKSYLTPSLLLHT